MNVRERLDYLVATTESYEKEDTPDELLKNLDKWKWGSYGWLAPASLIFTATWRKYFYPQCDCCKIWARDEHKKPIEGGYSIRTEDESITIPILAKYDLCTDYCSSNSGMQGSRALEKMRALKRLNIDFGDVQNTVFDLKLFATILNQINLLNSEQALRVLKYEICIAKNIQKKRLHTNKLLQEETSDSFNIMDFLDKIHDPELTKCIAAACLEALYKDDGLTLEGVSDYKTASDSRSKKPGDLFLSKNNSILIAIEVKDKTKTIDWNNIDRANKILKKYSSIITFIFILEKRAATVTSTMQEIINSPKLNSGISNKIIFISMHDLFLLASTISSTQTLASRTGYFMSKAPTIKPETKATWLKEYK